MMTTVLIADASYAVKNTLTNDHFFFFLAPFCVCVGSPQGLGYLRGPATTPAGWGLFAGCPRATHPTAPPGRQMGRWVAQVGAEKPSELRKRAACSAARVLGGVPFADASCSGRRRAASTPGWCLRSARTVSAHELQ